MIDVVRLLEALGIKVEFERGGELWARCPFPGHDERTPSWSIKNAVGHPKFGTHHCFGCGEGGGPIDLVMLRIGITASSAKRWIDERGLNVDDPIALKVYLDVEVPKYDFLVLPPQVQGVGALARWPASFRRFATRRGLTEAQVARWNIGYAADGTLKHRVVIPIHDEHGAMQSYTARLAYESDDPKVPKYLTASRKEGADHSGVFGALHWPAPGTRRAVYVTEGALNALAVERALNGAQYEGVAALDGSALLDGQALAIGTFEHIVIVSDPDMAGDLLAAKLQVFARWKKVSRATLPEGEDANSLPPDELKRILRGVSADGHRGFVSPRPRRSEATGHRGDQAASRQHTRSGVRSGDSLPAALPDHPPRKPVARSRDRA